MQNPDNGKTCAFFDLDKTLLSETTATLYSKYLYEKGDMKRWEMIKASYLYLKYRLNFLDVETMMKRFARERKGKPESVMISFCDSWFDSAVKDYIYPCAKELIKEHKQREHITAVLSGSIKYTCEPIVRFLSIDHCLSTQLEVQNGFFTGRLVEPLCIGKGKIYWAKRFSEEKGIDLEKSYFYTDSISDLPMLRIIGNPIVVNPDPILMVEAKRRGWRIIKLSSSQVELKRWLI
jgi:HAD superfamily hydrolase (TIGR01490 family)